MKRNKYLLLVPLLIVTMAIMAMEIQSARRFARGDLSGTATITASNSKNTPTVTVQEKVLIRDVKQVFPDVILGQIIIGSFAAAGGQDESGDIGELDSGFVRVYSDWSGKQITINSTDCSSLPCTASVEYFANIVDTLGGVQYVVGGWMDHIWITAAGSDTTGAGDTIAANVSWNLRFLYME